MTALLVVRILSVGVGVLFQNPSTVYVGYMLTTVLYWIVWILLISRGSKGRITIKHQ